MPDGISEECTAGINAKVAMQQRRTSGNHISFVLAISLLVYMA
jgi:hypothetical protein